MYTPINLDKTRNFRYGMVAVNRIEKALKINVAKIDMENLTMEETAVILWAGLVHEDAELTPDKIMALVDDHSSIPDVLEAMGKAFEEAFEDKKAKKSKNK